MKPFDAIGLGQVIAAAIVAAFFGSVGAQTCSGGSDGGMDATGNQCNDAVEADLEIDPDSPYEHLQPMSSGAAPGATEGGPDLSGAAQPKADDRAAFQRVRAETEAVVASPREH